MLFLAATLVGWIGDFVDWLLPVYLQPWDVALHYVIHKINDRRI